MRDLGPAPKPAPATYPKIDPLQLPQDPRHPDYDAAALFGAKREDVIDFFAAEPRDPTWAPGREDDLKKLALPRLNEVDPDAKIDVECHTGTCRVRVHSNNKALTGVMDAYPLTCLANTAVPMWGPTASDGSGTGSGPQDAYSDFYLLFGTETRQREGMLAANEDRCARYRDEWRKTALSGTVPKPEP